MQNKIEEKYEIGVQIGEGSSGNVMKCTLKGDESKKIYALKVIQRCKDVPDEVIKSEISIQSKLDHENIAKIIESHEDEEKAYILQEHFEGGDLMEYVLKNGVL